MSTLNVSNINYREPNADITISPRSDGGLVPSIDLTYDLGSSSKRWDNFYCKDMYTVGNMRINNGAPTITFSDNDHRSAYIHVNSNIFYILRGPGSNSNYGEWTQVNGGWPVEINLENNDFSVSGGTYVASDGVLRGGWVYAPNFVGNGAIRAWVNFSGYDLGIRGSYNISSISRIGGNVGQYTINVSTSLNRACAIVSSYEGTNSFWRTTNMVSQATAYTSWTVGTGNAGSSTNNDHAYIFFALIGYGGS